MLSVANEFYKFVNVSMTRCTFHSPSNDETLSPPRMKNEQIDKSIWMTLICVR